MATDFLPAVPSFPPLSSMTQDDLLRMFDRLLPDHYLAPLKSPGPGYEYLQAVAKMNAKVSEAVAHMGSGCYIGSATGGSRATATVELYRDTFIWGEVTLLAGSLVSTSDGYLYQTTTDVVFGATDLGPHSVVVEATARGWNWNKPGPVTTADGEYLPGSIDRFVAPVVPEPPNNNFDPTLQVRQLTEATGGSSQMLDGIGYDKGIQRQQTYAVIYFERPIGNQFAVTILPGSRVATADGYLYQTIDTATIAETFGLTYGTSTNAVRAIPLVYPDQYAAHGAISALNLLRWGSSPIDPTLTVVQQTAYSVESDDAYRARIALLPKTVTPANLRQQIEQTIGALVTIAGKAWALREIWDIRYQTAYDFPINTSLFTAEVNVPVPEYSSNIFVYDYAPADPLSNRYLFPDRGVVVIALPEIAGLESTYAGLAANLEATKPAGITLSYILT